MTYIPGSGVLFGLPGEVDALRKQAQEEKQAEANNPPPQNVRLPDRTITLEEAAHPTQGLVQQAKKAIVDHLSTDKATLDKITLKILEDIKVKARAYAQSFTKEDEKRLFSEVAEAYEAVPEGPDGRLVITNKHPLHATFDNGWRGKEGFNMTKLIAESEHAQRGGKATTHAPKRQMRWYAGADEPRET